MVLEESAKFYLFFVFKFIIMNLYWNNFLLSFPVRL